MLNVGGECRVGHDAIVGLVHPQSGVRGVQAGDVQALAVGHAGDQQTLLGTHRQPADVQVQDGLGIGCGTGDVDAHVLCVSAGPHEGGHCWNE